MVLASSAQIKVFCVVVLCLLAQPGAELVVVSDSDLCVSGVGRKQREGEN